MEQFVEKKSRSRLERVILQIQEFLTPQAFPTVIAYVHLVIALDVRVAAEDVSEQAGIGPHVTEQENILVGEQVPRAKDQAGQFFNHDQRFFCEA
jgi:hypothetical protein